MLNYFKAIISFPIALILSSLLIYLSNLTLSNFEDIFFNSIFYFLQTIIPYTLAGFCLVFTFLFLCDAKQISYETSKAPLNLIKLIYCYLLIFLLITFFIHGFPQKEYNLLPSNNILLKSTGCKYLFIGSIIGIILFFKNFHLTKIPMTKKDFEKWDDLRDEYISELVKNKEWRKLNYFLNEVYMDELFDKDYDIDELKIQIKKNI